MIKRILQHFAARVLTAGLSFAVVWLTARYLGAAGRGQVSLFFTDMSGLVLLAGLVGGSSLIYLVPRRNVWHLLLPAYGWALVVSVAGAAAVYLLRPVGPQYALHLGAVTLVQVLLSVNVFLLLGRQRERAYNVLTTAQAALLAGALVLAFGPWHWLTVDAYYYANYVAYGLPWLISIVLLLHLPDAWGSRWVRRHASARELARHSRGAHFSNLLSFANYRFGYYAVAYLADARALGVLSVGVALAEAIWLIPRSTALIQYVALVNAADKRGQTYAALRGSRLTLLATAGAVLVLAAVPAGWLAAIFGPEFGAARSVILALSPGILINGAGMQASTYFSGTARYGVNNRAALLGLAVTVPVCLLLVPRLGMVGAALGMSASYMASVAYLFWHYRQAMNAKWRDLLPGWNDVQWVTRRFLKNEE
ncbi:polysaccharide biosynthesis C-terminal domain-containing protein [Hymenobacter sp. BT770]|uniref:lipopolysaccharide biosynthesis protein n=1 Tax=Hymenobacter sp. BT770 TaxID=2886942 RepID=UPI001D10600E|nr:polysaccharide biosynthesis C-terminal domain-containing protein [Hymenobacter sp. BT770]MCC3154437.1 polysaccharide biosynthesis C-terminal domain-containing protein [Hymenobacter sp. BT770]MDO3416308.1 polysaccharide biosynthesis C-terminal domain-containing protein [Hymenobacter sp. BT770]